MRIDSVVVRSSESPGERLVGCVLAIKVLDQQQPVRITESEIVRVRKRHRGFLSSLLSF